MGGEVSTGFVCGGKHNTCKLGKANYFVGTEEGIHKCYVYCYETKE